MIKLVKKLYNKLFNKNINSINNDYITSIFDNSTLNTDFILDNNIIIYVISINYKEDKAKVIIKRSKKEIQV